MSTICRRTVVRTLNAAYHEQSYGGLGEANTTYPISAFITHIVYLKHTSVHVDVPLITVSVMIILGRKGHSRLLIYDQALGVRCIEVAGGVDNNNRSPQFDASCVRQAIRQILANDD